MLPFALTIGIAVTGYIIHRLQQHTYNGPTLNPQALTNCLRYTSTTNSYAQVLFNQAQAYVDPILNRPNIAAFIGTKGKDCDLFLETMSAAYQTGPWARSIFKITLGLNHQLKVTISPEIRKRFHMVGGSLPYFNTIILESLKNTATDKNKFLWEPAHVLRHEMTHAFIKLYNEKAGYPLSKPGFINEAKSAFDKSLSKIARMSATSFNFQELKLVEERTQLVKNQLNFYPDPGGAVEEIITHLIQFIPEPLIKKYFPFFATQMDNMIASFDHTPLTAHPEALDDDKWYTPNYALDQYKNNMKR